MRDIFEAIKDNNLDEVKSLIANGTDVNCGKENNWTPIMQAVNIPGTYDIVCFLIDSGADLSVKDGYGTSLLGMCARENEDPRLINLFLEKGFDINERSNGNYTPLLLAAGSNKSFQVIKTLVVKGADLSAVTYDNKNAWELAKENLEEYRTDFENYPVECNFLSSKICDYLKRQVYWKTSLYNTDNKQHPETYKTMEDTIKLNESKTIYKDESSKTIVRRTGENTFEGKHYDFIQKKKQPKRTVIEETDLKKLKILCIHGFGGKANSSTLKVVKKLCPQAEVIAEQFDLLNIKFMYERIKEINPDVIVGNSLGGFYTLTWPGHCKKIVINPCLFPSKEIPKLDNSISTDVISGWDAIENAFGEQSDHKAFGIFAKDDELFHYKDYFDALFKEPNSSSLLVDGTHKLKNPSLAESLEKAFAFFQEENNERA